MSARDRKLAMMLAPLAAFALYWVLLLNPALGRRAELQQPLADAQAQRDDAVARVAELTAARDRYKVHYAEVVKLADAIPETVAMSDLMRELNGAAEGTGIDFTKIAVLTEGSTSEEPSGPVVEGLDAIPVELTFDGRFFELADLFHSLQRFVTVADARLDIRGRLIRIDSFSFNSAAFPDITAQVKATVYASPAAEGATGGATPVGPPGAESGDGSLEPVGNFSTATVVKP